MVIRRAAQLLLILASLFTGGLAWAGVTDVRIGGDPDYPPFEWLQDGRPMGFHVDLGQAMGRATGASVHHVLRPWPQTVAALKAGEVDIVPMFKSEERENDFWFSEPIYFAHHAIYTTADPGGVSRVEELANWRIVVERSSFAHDEFRAMGLEANLLLAGTTKEAAKLLSEGRADYAVLATAPADHLIRTLALPLTRVGTSLWAREYAFAVRKDRGELIRWVEESFGAVVADGTFQRLERRWRDEAAMPPPAEGEILWWLIGALGGLSAGSGMWFLRRNRSELRVERERRSAAEESAYFTSRHDSLTRLPNTVHFAESISLMVRNTTLARPLELVVLKLRNLDVIAKNHGREAADNLLQSIASELGLAGLCAGSLARGAYGVVLQMQQAQDFAVSLERLTEAAGPIKPEFAWGACRSPEHGNDVYDLIHKAEVALNASIARRREWLVYEAAMEPDHRDLQLIKDFERFGKEQIFAAYQPQLELLSGKVLSAEVLARWNHPERGLIPPAEFVPLLESAGLVSHVTSRMLRDAVRQSVRFRQHGLACRFSVNLSIHDMREKDVPTLVADTIKEHSGTPENIVIELTESGAVENPERVRAILQRLKNMGVGTAIDDFGTGFSSLANLIELPFDELKIDQVFVAKMLESEAHKSIVRSAIQMAHEMGLSVVAEGAEDEATILALKEKGCDRVQGYGFSKPLDANALFRFCSTLSWRPWAGTSDQGQLRLSG